MDEQGTSATTLILGATGAVGQTLVARLLQSGQRVIAAGRDDDKLAALRDRFEIATVNADAAERGSIDAAIATVAKEHGPLTGIVNCIGSILLKPAHITTDDEFADVLMTNLYSSFETVRGAAKAMRKIGGSVVLLSSTAARMGVPNHEAIAAAKAGVEGLAVSAAATYSGAGIRVNVVAPGLVKSEMSRNIWENESAAEASLAMHPLGRLGEPEDIASLLAWLVDPANDWITGQVIAVDGGLGSIVQRQRRTSGH